MFDDPVKLVLGLVTGIIFGFLLQKGQVAKFRVIVGQLLLKDWTVVKIMGTAVAVGTVGVNLLVASGAASLHIQTASLARVVGGGVLFGIGMAIFGLCPGTSVAASGEGHRDAMVGVIGMLCGAGLYVALFPNLQPLFKAFPDFGKVTLPQVSGTPTGVWVAGVAVILGGGGDAAGKDERQPKQPGWVNMQGEEVPVANSFIFKGPVFNYCGDTSPLRAVCKEETGWNSPYTLIGLRP